ncbi:hypothetical protein P175DRAFT_0531667 [Aspergillus ochraceoroseus IBT 24754]|uniref:Uncharacterized protein n=1 Tax=Aspergillus ochraceoroseus IBT 24754 TaxID=1392256 RepID=A0A2T5M0Q1_9EURO|nr:uncharacterized protein P175DRAFT_0531667 [Aspergillus ochraceoroseus IBT 24754]PTU22117.1 hypothetical protein P175DRAFT_0531667 [Aspergillus ochraceoroseus IBT 24754]
MWPIELSQSPTRNFLGEIHGVSESIDHEQSGWRRGQYAPRSIIRSDHVTPLLISVENPFHVHDIPGVFTVIGRGGGNKKVQHRSGQNYRRVKVRKTVEREPSTCHHHSQSKIDQVPVEEQKGQNPEKDHNGEDPSSYYARWEVEFVNELVPRHVPSATNSQTMWMAVEDGDGLEIRNVLVYRGQNTRRDSDETTTLDTRQRLARGALLISLGLFEMGPDGMNVLSTTVTVREP